MRKLLFQTVEVGVSQNDIIIRKVHVLYQEDFGIYWTRFGRVRDGSFRGCMRDIEINKEKFDLTKSTYAGNELISFCSIDNNASEYREEDCFL